VKTNPNPRADGSVRAFEIPNSLWTFQLLKILRSVEGVSDVKQNWFSVHRFSFQFHGEPCVVVNDQWGSDRYWVGPENLVTSKLDVTRLHEAFQSYRLWWLADWDWKAKDDSAAPDSGSAFYVAVVACIAYFYALADFSLGTSFPKEVSSILAFLLLILPVIFCGLIQFAAVRNTSLSKVRQWSQIAGAALFAPLFGFFLALLVFGKSP